ncbi:hypothetical protein ACRYCC_01580 [Actinomadura scrupuli]|uniref:hypothetical protein n=1 Tax=Actinomadura scrupuli TaxID=559629 RepID=UPI003D975976
MTSSEARFAVLVRLGWELRCLAIGSAVTLPADGEAVLLVRCPDGFRLPVLAAQQDRRWLIIWSTHGEVPAVRPDLAAREIAGTVAQRRAV